MVFTKKQITVIGHAKKLEPLKLHAPSGGTDKVRESIWSGLQGPTQPMATPCPLCNASDGRSNGSYKRDVTLTVYGNSSSLDTSTVGGGRMCAHEEVGENFKTSSSQCSQYPDNPKLLHFYQ